MNQPKKRKGVLDGGNESDWDLLISVWCTCVGFIFVVLYFTGVIK